MSFIPLRVADSAGQIYFGDLFNQRIRVLVPLQTPRSAFPARLREVRPR